MEYPFVLVISDTQEPFAHRDAIPFCLAVQKRYSSGFKEEEKLVIHVGDESDQHTLSKYAADPNGRSGGDEFCETLIRLNEWFRAFPRVKVCASNHSYRYLKKAFASGIPTQFLKDVGEAYQAPPGWVWKDRWIFDGILYEHGENVSGPLAALNAALQNRMSTVIGHQHTFSGVIHSGSPVNQIFGMNVGCLIDIESYAFRYGKSLRKKPVLGCGVVIRGVPIFIPMILNSEKRWIGFLP